MLASKSPSSGSLTYTMTSISSCEISENDYAYTTPYLTDEALVLLGGRFGTDMRQGQEFRICQMGAKKVYCKHNCL